MVAAPDDMVRIPHILNVSYSLLSHSVHYPNECILKLIGAWGTEEVSQASYRDEYTGIVSCIAIKK